MKQLNRDMSKLSTSSIASTILECIGADVDEPHRHLTYLNQNDVSVISIGGGLQIGPTASFQIQLSEENVVYYLDKTCIVGELVVPKAGDLTNETYITNALSIFNPTTAAIDGSAASWSFGTSKYLLQMLIDRLRPEQLQKWRRGLMMHDPKYTYTTAAGLNVTDLNDADLNAVIGRATAA